MPLIRYICPDREEIPVTDCLAKCRMGTRCLTRPTLRASARDRPYTGIPSVTQLLRGTRQSWLEIRYEYAITPQSRAFMILGTGAHLVRADDSDIIMEERIELEGITGQFDVFSDELNEGVLTDYKTPGSYKVARALGYRQVDKDERGKNGRPIQRWKLIPGADDLEWSRQINMYRLMLEKVGFAVKHMQIECTIRDGGTWIARSRQVRDTALLIPVRRIPDHEVLGYFVRKRDLLKRYLEGEVLPPACDEEESWDHKRCQSFCPVWNHCDVGMLHHKED